MRHFGLHRIQKKATTTTKDGVLHFIPISLNGFCADLRWQCGHAFLLQYNHNGHTQTQFCLIRHIYNDILATFTYEFIAMSWKNQ